MLLCYAAFNFRFRYSHRLVLKQWLIMNWYFSNLRVLREFNRNAWKKSSLVNVLLLLVTLCMQEFVPIPLQFPVGGRCKSRPLSWVQREYNHNSFSL
jgi:hypothetical protein